MTTDAKDRKHIGELHFEHKVWLNELNFFKDELKIFNHRLEELAAANTKIEVTSNIEAYQNRFIRGNEVIDELIHRINGKESDLAQYAADHPVAIDHVLFQDHNKLREDVERNAELYNEMKSEFTRFVADWL